MKQSLFLIIILLVLVAACKPEKVPVKYTYRNAHEEYLGSLDKAGLLETAMGADWKKLSEQSLENPVNIELPYQEEFFLDPAVPGSVGYRFVAKRGQKTEIEIQHRATDSALLFIDLFREEDGEIDSWIPVASADKEELMLRYESRQDNYYILRIQPELLRGGEFSVKIIEKPSLEFPVLGGNKRDIGSFFNDPRPGYRKHHGVDIFASRHTPVIAPVRSRVRRVGESDIGGRHVWLHDSMRAANYYFAHLQDISAVQDEWVNPGDTIGTVGNTGNARTTPPHLHFGIYLHRQGPIDPLIYILKTDITPDRIKETNLELNSWVQIKDPAQIAFHITGIGDQDSLLPENTVYKVLGKHGKYLRVQLENSVIGRISTEDLL